MKKTIKKVENIELGTRQKLNEKMCHNCSVKISGTSHSIKTNEGRLMELCNKCYENLAKASNMQSKDINTALAVIFGLALGIIGALIWFGAVVITKWQIGLVAIAVGWLAGFGVHIGSGKKRAVSLQIISAIVAFISILFGQYLITNHFVHQILIEKMNWQGGYFLNPIIIIETVFSSLAEAPMTILFLGIATWVAYTIARPLKQLQKI